MIYAIHESLTKILGYKNVSGITDGKYNLSGSRVQSWGLYVNWEYILRQEHFLKSIYSLRKLTFIRKKANIKKVYVGCADVIYAAFIRILSIYVL